MPKKIKDNLSYIVMIVTILTAVIGYSFQTGAASQKIATCEEKLKSFNLTIAEVRKEIQGVRDDGRSIMTKQDETSHAVYKILGHLGLN